MSDFLRSSKVLRQILIAYGTYCVAVELGKLGGNLLKRRKSEKDLLEQKEGGKDESKSQVWCHASTLEDRKPGGMWNTAIFFPDLDLLNKDPDAPTARLLKLIDGAKVSIRVCVFCFSYGPLVKAISRKRQQGLIVQIVSSKRVRIGRK